MRSHLLIYTVFNVELSRRSLHKNSSSSQLSIVLFDVEFIPLIIISFPPLLNGLPADASGVNTPYLLSGFLLLSCVGFFAAFSFELAATPTPPLFPALRSATLLFNSSDFIFWRFRICFLCCWKLTK